MKKLLFALSLLFLSCTSPEIGTRDVTTSFSTWQSLKVGDRTNFKYQKPLNFGDAIWLGLAVFYILGFAIIVVGCLIMLLCEIWKY